jgi:hypothetical protein
VREKPAKKFNFALHLRTAPHAKRPPERRPSVVHYVDRKSCSKQLSQRVPPQAPCKKWIRNKTCQSRCREGGEVACLCPARSDKLPGKSCNSYPDAAPDRGLSENIRPGRAAVLYVEEQAEKQLEKSRQRLGADGALALQILGQRHLLGNDSSARQPVHSPGASTRGWQACRSCANCATGASLAPLQMPI